VILVDTSVWIDHLRQGDAELQTLLNAGLVLAHPFVTGELALASLHQRDVVLDACKVCPKRLLPPTRKFCALLVSRLSSESELAISTPIYWPPSDFQPARCYGRWTSVY
jgi:hypothetical protein